MLLQRAQLCFNDKMSLYLPLNTSFQREQISMSIYLLNASRKNYLELARGYMYSFCTALDALCLNLTQDNFVQSRTN